VPRVPRSSVPACPTLCLGMASMPRRSIDLVPDLSRGALWSGDPRPHRRDPGMMNPRGHWTGGRSWGCSCAALEVCKYSK
jgi:hypothetical protein